MRADVVDDLKQNMPVEVVIQSAAHENVCTAVLHKCAQRRKTLRQRPSLHARSGLVNILRPQGESVDATAPCDALSLQSSPERLERRNQVVNGDGAVLPAIDIDECDPLIFSDADVVKMVL